MTPATYLLYITRAGLSMLGMALVLLAAGEGLARIWEPFG